MSKKSLATLVPILALTLLVLLAAKQGDGEETTPVPPEASSAAREGAPGGELGGFLRGMTITCPRSGQIWGSDSMREALRQLPPLGVEWITIHPYSWIGKDGSLRFRPAASIGYLNRAMSITAEEGLQMFLKPHLGYWGSFEWRGVIQFGEDETAWRRFFDEYQEFIVDQAAFAEQKKVPLFAVGV